MTRTFGKVSDYIRTVPPDMVKDSTIVFDAAVRSCFEKIVSSSLTDDQWSQCTLNLKCGGLGLRSVSMHAAAAYIASVTQNREAIANSVCRSDVYDIHQHLTKTIATYNQSVIPIHCIDTSSQCIPSQKKLSSVIDDTVYLSLCTPATLPQDKARLTAVAAPHASAWLLVVPNNNLGLYLSPHEWRAVTRWWIGADVNTEDSECPFCHQHQDKSGRHATVCNTNGERISAVNTTLFVM